MNDHGSNFDGGRRQISVRLLLLLSMLLLNRTFALGLDAVHVNIVPTNKIGHIFFDRDGYMWIGSVLGLARYDGTTAINIEPSGPALGIGSIIQDDSGRIWCIGEDHSAYYVKEDRLVRIRPAGKREWVNNLMAFNGKVYITTSKGLSVYDIGSLRYREYESDLSPSMGLDLFNSGGRVFVYSLAQRSPLMFTGTGLKKTPITAFGKTWPLFFQGRKGRIFAVSREMFFGKIPLPIYRIEYTGGQFEAAVEQVWKGSDIYSISPVGKEGYWITSRTESRSSDGRVYQEPAVYQACPDREGNTWFVSANGLSVSYKKEAVRSVPGVNENVFSLAAKDSFLYLGVMGEILKYNVIRKRIVRRIAIPERKPSFGRRLEVGFIKYLSGRDFVIQSNIHNYFFNDSTLLFRYLGGATFLNNAARSGDIVYMASDNLSFYYNIRYPEYKGTSTIPSRLLHKYCYNCLLSIPDVAVIPRTGQVVFATDSNVFAFRKGISTPLDLNKKQVVASALLYANGQLYIAAEKAGLLTYNNGQMRQLIGPAELGPERVSKIRTIGSHFWLINEGAVKLVDIRKGKLVRNGLTGDYNASDAATYGNEAFFLCSNKLFSVDLNGELAAPSLPCKNLHTVINGRDTSYQDKIEAGYRQNDLEFHLSYPVFSSPEKTSYRYRLKGAADSAWKVSKSGGIRFASLMPGRYVFEAIALHPVLGNSRNTLSYPVFILPPWWDTWAFKAVLLLAFTGAAAWLIRGYYRGKLSNQKAYFEGELAIERERQRISREIHDDIGQSLSVIKLNLSIGAPAQLQEAKGIINDVIKNLRELAHNLSYGKLLMNDLATSLKTDIERLNHASPEFATVQAKGELLALKPEHEIGLYRIYQEAVNNAIKYANASHITVLLEQQSDGLYLKVMDDGQGFETENARHGLGLTNMQNRAKEMGATFAIRSTPGKGTEISVHLPKAGRPH